MKFSLLKYILDWRYIVIRLTMWFIPVLKAFGLGKIAVYIVGYILERAANWKDKDARCAVFELVQQLVYGFAVDADKNTLLLLRQYVQLLGLNISEFNFNGHDLLRLFRMAEKNRIITTQFWELFYEIFVNFSDYHTPLEGKREMSANFFDSFVYDMPNLIRTLERDSLSLAGVIFIGLWMRSSKRSMPSDFVDLLRNNQFDSLVNLFDTNARMFFNAHQV